MATTTFQGIVRSAGGDDRKRVYPGTVALVVPFYIADPTAANTTNVTRSATDARSVILPTNAIVSRIDVNADATGGTDPTFDLGWIELDDSTTFDVDGLVAEGDADVGGSVFDISTTTAGADMLAVMSSSSPVIITGGVGASAATGGTISGYITYFMQDFGTWAN